MESLSVCLSSLLKLQITTHKTPLLLSYNLHKNPKSPLKPHFSLPILVGTLSFSSSLPSFASEIADTSGQVSDKINIESILVAIDDFNNKNPFFVAGVTFIWLIVLPLMEEYLRKYKTITSINGFKKLRDDSSAQLLDIRDEKSLNFMGSPNLRMLKKEVTQIPFSEGDEDGFVKNVMERFGDPKNTVVCILDNFDGDSIKVAELLVNNGFKEAYAIEGGMRGKKGWLEIQEEFLPPSVHVFPNRKAKKPQNMNGVSNQSDADQYATTSEN